MWVGFSLLAFSSATFRGLWSRLKGLLQLSLGENSPQHLRNDGSSATDRGTEKASDEKDSTPSRLCLEFVFPVAPLPSLAKFELELIRERVKAGMDRAARQGKKIGRPRVTDGRGFQSRYKTILERLSVLEKSQRGGP